MCDNSLEDAQNSEKLFYSQLGFIRVKGCSLKEQRKKTHREESRKTGHKLPIVLSWRGHTGSA